MKRLLAFCAIPVLAAAATLVDISVKPDKMNVVATSISGRWTPDTELNARMRGEKSLGTIEFEVNNQIFGQRQIDFDEGVENPFKNRRAFLSGLAKIQNREVLFAILERHGMSVVAFLRMAEDQKRVIDVEYRPVFATRSNDSKGDLLLFGSPISDEVGDASKIQFTAFSRPSSRN